MHSSQRKGSKSRKAGKSVNYARDFEIQNHYVDCINIGRDRLCLTVCIDSKLLFYRGNLFGSNVFI